MSETGGDSSERQRKDEERRRDLANRQSFWKRGDGKKDFTEPLRAGYHLYCPGDTLVCVACGTELPLSMVNRHKSCDVWTSWTAMEDVMEKMKMNGQFVGCNPHDPLFCEDNVHQLRPKRAQKGVRGPKKKTKPDELQKKEERKPKSRKENGESSSDESESDSYDSSRKKKRRKSKKRRRDEDEKSECDSESSRKTKHRKSKKEKSSRHNHETKSDSEESGRESHRRKSKKKKDSRRKRETKSDSEESKSVSEELGRESDRRKSKKKKDSRHNHEAKSDSEESGRESHRRKSKKKKDSRHKRETKSDSEESKSVSEESGRESDSRKSKKKKDSRHNHEAKSDSEESKSVSEESGRESDSRKSKKKKDSRHKHEESGRDGDDNNSEGNDENGGDNNPSSINNGIQVQKLTGNDSRHDDEENDHQEKGKRESKSNTDQSSVPGAAKTQPQEFPVMNQGRDQSKQPGEVRIVVGSGSPAPVLGDESDGGEGAVRRSRVLHEMPSSDVIAPDDAGNSQTGNVVDADSDRVDNAGTKPDESAEAKSEGLESDNNGERSNDVFEEDVVIESHERDNNESKSNESDDNTDCVQPDENNAPRRAPKRRDEAARLIADLKQDEIPRSDSHGGRNRRGKNSEGGSTKLPSHRKGKK